MKFKHADERYLSQRDAFASLAGMPDLWSIVDHWPLYCGVANLARFMAIADLLRGVLDVPGHVAEFGSWRGANVLFLAKLLRIWDPHGSKQVFCFDTFDGLRSFAAQDGSAVQFEGAYTGSLDVLHAVIQLYEMQDDIVIQQGLIEDTLPRVLDARPELTFSFVYCDTDLYASTSTILRSVDPRLAKGGIIACDEWNDAAFPGEGTAVNEFLQQRGDDYEICHLLHSRKPSLVMKKIRD